MKLVFTSDTHARHRDLKVPDGDIFIHCGDISRYGEINTFLDFNDWLRELPHTFKLFTAGNHDRARATMIKKMITNGIFLNESGFEWGGVKFWGSPQTPSVWDRKEEYCFVRNDEEDATRIWNRIPDKVDVLITHGPPFGILDYVNQTVGHQGDKYLLDRILQVKPKIHGFGHIHEEGESVIKQRYGIKFINCSAMDGDYSMVNKCMVAII